MPTTRKKQAKPKITVPDGWKLTPSGTVLKKQFTFKDYLSGFLFVARVSVHAEVLQHHPEIKLRYGSVAVSLTTHDAGTVTEKDILLAKRIDQSFMHAQ